MDVDRLPVNDRSGGRSPTADRIHLAQGPRDRKWATVCCQPVNLAVDTVDFRVFCLAEPRSTFRDSIQHRVKIRRRARDDAQDLARRRLLLERLRQIAVARLQLLEQPHVLDGDHRLRGKGPE